MLAQKDIQSEPRTNESAPVMAEHQAEIMLPPPPVQLAMARPPVIEPTGTQPRRVEPMPRRGLIVAGAVLIVVGLLALFGTIFQSEIVGLFVLPMLGLIFLTWGFAVREPGPMIPGSILTGLGLGVLVSQEWPNGLASDVGGAIVLIGLALGFLAIAPLTWLVAKATHYWALIPGSFLLLLGVSLLLGALDLVTFLGTYFWPAFVVALGLFFIWRAYQPRRNRPAS